MKASELMIGDWVLALTSRGEEFSPTRVKNIYDADEDEPCGTIMETYGRIIGSYEFKPIILTEEILKANGITREYYKYNGGASETYKYVYKGEWLSIAEGNGFYFFHQCKLYYVHELQHTLRLCGLNELADNFKV